MSVTTNAGRNYEIRNISANATTDTALDFNNKFINSIIVRSRTTTIDLYLRRNIGDADYITIPAGQTLTLDCSLIDQTQGGYIIGYIRSASGTPVIEVLGTID